MFKNKEMIQKKKQLTFITGQFESMTPVQLLEIEGRPTKKRSTATISTDDGQKLYLEMRDAIISRVKKLGIQNGDVVTVGIVFIGSEKKGGCYNNLFLNDIDYAKKE